MEIAGRTENRQIEVKERISNTFLKTVSAYANYGTGEIRFGVSDNGEVRGIKEPQQACLALENRINDAISPIPEFRLEVERETNVIILTVYESPHKPYLYKGKAYRRSDTATVAVEQTELKRLVLLGSNLSFERLPYKGTKLRFSILEKSLSHILGLQNVDGDTLKTLGLLTDDGHYNNAAALVADENMFAGVDIAKFGSSVSEIMDRKTISGCSVLAQYAGAVQMYQTYYQYEKIEEIERKTVERVPETAFREAVANALIHRTWDVDTNIRIEMQESEIRILSPGGLPYGISENEYLDGKISTFRNPLLGMLFFRLRYIEMFGTGIRRIKTAYESAIQKPRFEIGANSIMVILPVTDAAVSLTTDEETVYRAVMPGRSLSAREIIEATGFSKAKTIRLLNSLAGKHYITVLGNGRGTKYVRE